MEIISFIGIVAALILIILGSVRGYSLILLSTVAALLVAATGGVNVFENYANVYMGGVANMVLALFPIFLGGQMFGKMLEMSGLPMAVASGVFRKLGPASAVAGGLSGYPGHVCGRHRRVRHYFHHVSPGRCLL